jgi:AbrB family looped-hinge helix DNA binding protein
MEIELTKMSSRGQVVIPQKLRDKMKVKEGSVFAVFGSDDSFVLKKITVPNKERFLKSLEKISKEGRKRAEELGIKESDVPEMIHRLRKEKNENSS